LIRWRSLPQNIAAHSDLIFIDADKENYPAYPAAASICPVVAPIIADNVIRDGEVINPEVAIRGFRRASFQPTSRTKPRVSNGDSTVGGRTRRMAAIVVAE
jgi:predicted O-methyltransferase YrrM